MVIDLGEREPKRSCERGEKVRIEERLGDQRRSKPDSTGMMPHDKQNSNFPETGMSYLHGKLWMDGMFDAWQMPNSVSFLFFSFLWRPQLEATPPTVPT